MAIIPASAADVTDKVLMVPVAMVCPNARCVYAPSRIGRSFYADRANLAAIKDHSREILVSFEKDGVSNPEPVTAYGLGWHCWYIAVDCRGC